MDPKLHPLPQIRQKPFRQWLENSQFDTLIEVLESQAYGNEVECVNAMVKSHGAPDYKQKAEDAANLARTIFAAVSLLQRIRESKQHNIFTTTPTKIEAPQAK